MSGVRVGSAARSGMTKSFATQRRDHMGDAVHPIEQMARTARPVPTDPSARDHL